MDKCNNGAYFELVRYLNEKREKQKLGNPNISSGFLHVQEQQLYEISVSKALLPWQLREF